MQVDAGVIENGFDHRSITRLGHALEPVREVIVVIIEAQGQAFQDRRGRSAGAQPHCFSV